MLVLFGLTFFNTFLGTVDWPIYVKNSDENALFGFGILISSILFNIFMKKNLKQSAFIIIVFTILVNCLIQFDAYLSLTVSTLSVLIGFAYSFLFIWIYSTFFLYFQGRFDMLVLALVWSNVGAYAMNIIRLVTVYFSN